MRQAILKEARRNGARPRQSPGQSLAGAEKGLERERDFMWLMQDVYLLIDKAFDRRMRRIGLSRAQWRVLSALFRKDGLTQTEIADYLQLEKAPLGRLIDRMLEAGYVERRPDPVDRRARRVFLTDKVTKLIPVIRAAAAELFAEALGGLSQGDLKAITDRLEKIRKNLAPAQDGSGA